MDTPPQEFEWYLARDGQRYGPISDAEIRDLVSSGHVKSEDLVWRQGFSEWVEAQTVPGLLDTPQASAPELQQTDNNYQKPESHDFKPEPIIERGNDYASFESSHKNNREHDDTYVQQVPRKKKGFVRRFASFVFFLAILGGAAVFVLPAIIPADFIREEIARQVKENTGRTLTVRGKSSFSIVPNIGVQMNNVSLSNPPTMVGEPIIKMDSLNVQLKLWPLLEQKIEVKRFILTKPQVSLKVDGRGKNNWTFAKLFRPHKPVQLASASGIENNKTTEQDDSYSDLKYFIHKIFYGPVYLSGQAITDIQDVKLDEIKVIDGILTYHDEKANFSERFDQINLKISLTNLASWLTASGSTIWKARDVSFDLGLQSPKKLIDGEKLPMTLNVKSNDFRHFFNGEVSWADGIYLTGESELQIPYLRNFTDWLGFELAETNGMKDFAIRGKLDAQSHKWSFTNATINMDGMNITGEANLFLGRRLPYLKASLKADTIDLNTYLKDAEIKESQLINPNFQFSEQTGTQNGYVQNVNQSGIGNSQVLTTSGVNGRAPERGQISARPINSFASSFEYFDADIDLSSNKIIYENIRIGKSQANMKIRKGILNATVPNIDLYSGKAVANIKIDGKGAIPQFNSQVTISDISAKPFLKDAQDFDWISGKTNIKLNISGQGHTHNQIVASLKGTGNIAFVDGAIEGINIPKMIRSLQKGQFEDWNRNSNEKTDFSELTASFKMNRGVADTKDINFIAPLVRAQGKGSVDLNKSWVDYRLKPKIVGDLEGQGTKRRDLGGLAIPVRLQGPIDDPKISLDLDINDIVKNPEKVVKSVNNAIKAIKKKKKVDFESLIQGVLGGDDNSEGSGNNLKF